MLIEEYVNNSRTIRVGVIPYDLPYLHFNGTIRTGEDWGLDLPHLDEVMLTLRNVEFLSPSYDIGAIFGLAKDPGDRTAWFGQRHIPSDQGLNELMLKRSSIWKNILALLGKGNVGLDYSKPRGQNPATHANYLGNVVSQLQSCYIREFFGPEPYSGSRPTQAKVLTYPYTYTMTDFAGSATGLALSSALVSIPELRESVNSGSLNQTVVGTDYTTVQRYDDFEYEFVYDPEPQWYPGPTLFPVCKLSYTVYQEFFDNIPIYLGAYNREKFLIELEIWFKRREPLAYTQDYIEVSDIVDVEVSLNSTNLLRERRLLLPVPTGYNPSNLSHNPGTLYLGVVQPIPGSRISYATKTDFDSPSGGIVNGFNGVSRSSFSDWDDWGRRDNLLEELKSSIQPVISDLWAGVFYASQDAISSHFDEVGSNMIEFMSDLQDIKSLIDPMMDFAALAKAVKQGNPVQTMRSLLDVLSSAQLLYTYAVKPTAGDIENVASKASRLRALYGKSRFRDQLYAKQTIDGKFRFTVPEGFGALSSSIVTYRSHLRLGINPDSVLTAILPIRAFGLFPSLKNLWDLLPFSFIADWFVNLSDRLAAVDDQALLLCADVDFSVNTMLVERYLDSGHLVLHGCNFYPGNDTAPRIGYYVRGSMRAVPVLTESVFDFNPPSLPDIATSVSLLWKTL